MSQDSENPYSVTDYGAVVDYLLLDGNVNVGKDKGLGQLLMTRTSIFALRAGNTSMQTGMAAGGLIGALIGYWLDKRRKKKLPPSEHLTDPEVQNLDAKAHKRIAQSRLIAKLPLNQSVVIERTWIGYTFTLHDQPTIKYQGLFNKKKIAPNSLCARAMNRWLNQKSVRIIRVRARRGVRV